MFLLKIDNALEQFMNDSSMNQLVFPKMNGYYRMACHKMAELFGLGHSVDNNGGKQVIVVKCETSFVYVYQILQTTLSLS